MSNKDLPQLKAQHNKLYSELEDLLLYSPEKEENNKLIQKLQTDLEQLQRLIKSLENIELALQEMQINDKADKNSVASAFNNATQQQPVNQANNINPNQFAKIQIPIT